jgi:hypothetical protein
MLCYVMLHYVTLHYVPCLPVLSLPCRAIIPQTAFCCRGSGGVSPTGRGLLRQFPGCGDQLLCAGCGDRECRVAPVYAKCSVISFSTEKHNGFSIFFSRVVWLPRWPPGGPDASQMPPRCLPDAQMPPRSLPDASQMPPRCLPDAFQMSPRCLLLNRYTDTQTSSHSVTSTGHHKKQRSLRSPDPVVTTIAILGTNLILKPLGSQELTCHDCVALLADYTSFSTSLCCVLSYFVGLLHIVVCPKLQTLTVVTTIAILGTNLILKPLGSQELTCHDCVSRLPARIPHPLVYPDHSGRIPP